MITDQYGRVLVERPLFIEDIIVSAVDIKAVNTPYRNIGDTLPVICLALVTLLLLAKRIIALRRN